MKTQNYNEIAERAVSESVQQYRVVRWLEQRGHIFFAVPNGYKKSVFQQSQAKREGLKAGVPDIIILTKAKNGEPTALEMKKYMGSGHRLPCKCIKESQLEWQTTLVGLHWNHVLAHGYDEAINDLIALGY